jgi:hypothetical protein
MSFLDLRLLTPLSGVLKRFLSIFLLLRFDSNYLYSSVSIGGTFPIYGITLVHYKWTNSDKEQLNFVNLQYNKNV